MTLSSRLDLELSFSLPLIDAAIDVIEENVIPLSPLPEEAGDTGAKRLILWRFPYDIVTIELPEETVVIAIAHHSRKPGYWLGRGKS
jgi:hypothetical protein